MKDIQRHGFKVILGTKKKRHKPMLHNYLNALVDLVYRQNERGVEEFSKKLIFLMTKVLASKDVKGLSYEDLQKILDTMFSLTDMMAGLTPVEFMQLFPMYCGNGKEVEASINEKGTATGGKPGDQTGTEFLIRPYRNYPWNVVLRHKEAGISTNGGNYMFEVKTVQKGEKGNHVLLVQEILRARGIKGKDGKALKLDKDCGDNTAYAIREYQKAREKVDPGICGGVDGAAGPKTLHDMIAL